MPTTVFDDIDNVIPVDCLELIDSNSYLNSFESGDDSNDASMNLKIFHLNIRSYGKNIDQVLIFLQDLKTEFDIIILGEAWLSYNTLFVSLDGYDIITTTQSQNKNDGLVIYAKTNLAVRNVEVNFNGVFGLSLDFGFGGRSFNVLSVYRTHETSMDMFISDLKNHYQSMSTGKSYIFIGDINCNILDGTLDRYADTYLDIMYDAGFVKGIDRPTRVTESSATLIDHIFIKHNNYNAVRTGVLHSNITDHYAVLVEVKCARPPRASGSETSLMVTGKSTYIDYTVLAQLTGEQDWSAVTSLSDPDQSAEMFVNIVKELTDNSKKPKRQFSSKLRKIKPWITIGIIKSIRHRDKLNQLLKKQPFNRDLRDYFSHYRNKLTELIRTVKKDYYRGKLSNQNYNPKTLWSTINELRGKSNKKEAFPLKHFLNDNQAITTSSVKEIANKFNSFFSNVGENLARVIPAQNQPVDEPELNTQDFNEPFFLNPVSEQDVHQCIFQLRGNSAPGLDGIQAKYLKDNINSLVVPLTHVINCSIKYGVYPKIFKCAKVIPLYKSDEKDNVSNYRPISLLSVCAKILEKLVKKQLSSYLTNKKIICEQQFGFRSGKNITDALYNFVKEIHKSNNNTEKHCLVVFLDLAKAFDSIDRGKLIKKLNAIGVRGGALEWFKSYLSTRSQVVNLCGVESDPLSINYGVIQGSTLGPILFSIYFNNIAKIPITGKPFLFADDTAIIFKNKNWHEVFQNANNDLACVNKWLAQNTLTLNVKKTKYMILTRKNIQGPVEQELKLHSCGDGNNGACTCPALERVLSFKYLGIYIDHKLSWMEHTLALKNRMRKLIFVFRQLADILSSVEIKQAYYAFAQSIMQYGIIAWGGASKIAIDSILISQKSILKASFKKPQRYPTELLFSETGVMDIRQLYVKTLLLFFFKYRSLFIEPIQHTYSTRHARDLNMYIPNIEVSSSSYMADKVIRNLFMNIPSYVRNTEAYTISSFKRKINEWLLSTGRSALDDLITSVYRY
jgi:hypothetical protein